jgi:hypothetical protein
VFHLESAPGNGTRIIVDLPYQGVGESFE